MRTRSFLGLATIGALAIGSGGCSSYATVVRPWRNSAPAWEFESGAAVQPGDRSRVTLVDQRVIEGALVDMDSLTVVIRPESSTGETVAIPTPHIARFEVHAPASWKPVRTAVLVVAGSVAAYVVVDDLTHRNEFTPDVASTKRR